MNYSVSCVTIGSYAGNFFLDVSSCRPSFFIFFDKELGPIIH